MSLMYETFRIKWGFKTKLNILQHLLTPLVHGLRIAHACHALLVGNLNRKNMQLRFVNGAKNTETLDYYLLLETQFLTHFYVLSPLWAIFFFNAGLFCRSRMRKYKWWGPRTTCIYSTCAPNDQVNPGVGRTKTIIQKIENQRGKQKSAQQKNQLFFVHKSLIPCIFCSCAFWPKSKLLYLRA